MKKVKDKVIAVIRDELGATVDIKTTDSLVNDLNADSLDTITMIMAIEEEFHIELSDESCEKVKTVQDAIDLVYATV